MARYAWLESRRFELLGAWVPSVAELDVKALLATQSHHHAWHASLWERHLPHRSGHQPGAGSVEHPLAPVIAAVAGAEAILERLVGAYRVLAAAAVAAYTRELECSHNVSGAAVARTCRLILADQVDDRAQGEAALEALVRPGDDVTRADAHQVRLERLLVEAGGFAGPRVTR